MVALMKMPPQMTIRFPGSPAAATESRKSGAERRVFPRKETSAEIQGKRIDHSLAALRQPHLSLALRDISLGGLSAISDTPLQCGERVSVSFPGVRLAGGTARGGFDATGRVLRCETSGMGYRIAVEFDTLPAAA